MKRLIFIALLTLAPLTAHAEDATGERIIRLITGRQ